MLILTIETQVITISGYQPRQVLVDRRLNIVWSCSKLADYSLFTSFYQGRVNSCLFILGPQYQISIYSIVVVFN